MKTQPFLVLISLGIALLLLGACSASAPTAVAVQPTAAPVPPTATTVLPTATNTLVPMTATSLPPTATDTSVPPTATNTAVPPTKTSTPTLVPPTATATKVPPSPTSTSKPTSAPVTVASIIQAALAKNKASGSYEAIIDYQVGDAEFLHWAGEVHGKNLHTDFYSDFYSEDSEVIAVGDKMYQRPYNASTKSYDGDWNTLPREDKVYYLQSPQTILTNLAGSTALYQKGDATTLDGLQCQSYTHQDKAGILRAVLAAAKGMGEGFALSKDTIGARGDELASVTICSDGYVHAAGVIMYPSANSGSGSPQLGKIVLIVTMYNMNSNIDIKAP